MLNSLLGKGPQKNLNVNFFQKGWGGQPQSLHLIIKKKIDKWTKNQKKKSKSLHFEGVWGGSQGQFGKCLHFYFFWTLPLVVGVITYVKMLQKLYK